MSEEISEDDFVRVPYGDGGGTSRQLGFRTSFRALHHILDTPDYFQEPGSSVVFQWLFKNARTGATVAIYDYKATSLYNPMMRSPEELSKLPAFNWSVAAPNREEARLFAAALERNVGGRATP